MYILNSVEWLAADAQMSHLQIHVNFEYPFNLIPSKVYRKFRRHKIRNLNTYIFKNMENDLWWYLLDNLKYQALVFPEDDNWFDNGTICGFPISSTTSSNASFHVANNIYSVYYTLNILCLKCVKQYNFKRFVYSFIQTWSRFLRSLSNIC